MEMIYMQHGAQTLQYFHFQLSEEPKLKTEVVHILDLNWLSSVYM